MESTKVEGADSQVLHKVYSDARSVGIGGRVRLLEPAFVTHTNKMIGIDRFDVGGDFGGPSVDGGSSGVAVCHRGAVRASAPRFVGELPGHDSRFVLVARYPGGDVLFVSGDDVGVCVELVVRGWEVGELRACGGKV
jgi:hypothetical protein